MISHAWEEKYAVAIQRNDLAEYSDLEEIDRNENIYSYIDGTGDRDGYRGIEDGSGAAGIVRGEMFMWWGRQ